MFFAEARRAFVERHSCRATWSRLGATTVFLASWAAPAAAYVDPGTGSMLVQLMGAAVLGAIFFLRDLRTRVISFLSGIFRRSAGAATKEKD